MKTSGIALVVLLGLTSACSKGQESSPANPAPTSQENVAQETKIALPQGKWSIKSMHSSNAAGEKSSPQRLSSLERKSTFEFDAHWLIISTENNSVRCGIEHFRNEIKLPEVPNCQRKSELDADWQDIAYDKLTEGERSLFHNFKLAMACFEINEEKLFLSHNNLTSEAVDHYGLDEEAASFHLVLHKVLEEASSETN